MEESFISCNTEFGPIIVSKKILEQVCLHEVEYLFLLIGFFSCRYNNTVPILQALSLKVSTLLILNRA